MRVAVVGTGYVGLVSGVCLAAKGHDVTCVDINPAIVEALNRGSPHIHEKGLAELLTRTVETGLFRATSRLNEALDRADLVLIAVGTPSTNGVIDLRYIRSAAQDIGAWLKDAGRFVSVVVKSTVVPGTTDSVVLAELEASSGLKLGAFGLGMNPEFLREGEAIIDFMEPDRIVFGHEDHRTLAALEELYAPWSCDKIAVSTRTAEMIKYANNAILAVQISAMNEIANVSTRLGGIDMRDVVNGVALDKRWSPIVGGHRVVPGIVSYLVPGCGFGGSCFPKDVQAIRSLGESVGLPMAMLNAVLSVNDDQPLQVGAILADAMGNLDGVKVLILGLAFKPETDDVRESASFPIIADLLDRGAVVTAHDPIATPNFKAAMGSEAAQVRFVDNWKPLVADHDAIIIVTRWDDYRDIVAEAIDGKPLFDVRRLLAPEEVGSATYLTIGRNFVRKTA